MKSCLVVDAEEVMAITDMATCCREGFVAAGDKEDISWLASSAYFVSRDTAEQDESIKQIIPVVIFMDDINGNIIIYQRKAKHTEQRLAGKWTCAFGGHIDLADAEKSGNAIDAALVREIKEETGMDINLSSLMFAGFVYDESDAVGRVHLGIVYVCPVRITNELIDKIKSKDEIETAFVLTEAMTYEQLHYKERHNMADVVPIEFEGWARIILKYMLSYDA